jgi:hypothetical protein
LESGDSLPPFEWPNAEAKWISRGFPFCSATHENNGEAAMNRRRPRGSEPLEDWGKLIGDMPAATAILDRFLHHAEVIAINGKSYRLHPPGT